MSSWEDSMLRLSLVLVALLASPAALSARTWHVNSAGTGDAPTIQAAAIAAAPGDTVLISPGTYFEQDIPLRPGLTVQGDSNDETAVSIVGDASARVFSGVSPAETFQRAILQALTIQGDAGGLYLERSSATLRRVVFQGTVADRGAAIETHRVPILKLEHCTFRDGLANCGGALYLGEGYVTIAEDCLFEHNANHAIAAPSALAQTILTRCRFLSNHDTGSGLSGGGAVYTAGWTSASGSEFGGNSAGQGGAFHGAQGPHSFSACEFHDNSAQAGGAFFSIDGSSSFSECDFRDNTASLDGGAVSALRGSVDLSSTTLVGNRAEGDGGAVSTTDAIARFSGCAFRQNASDARGGAAVFLRGGPDIRECLFAGNHSATEGGALAYRSVGLSEALHASTFWGNSAQTAGAIHTFATNLFPDSTLVAFNAGGGAADGIVGFRCSNLFGNVGGDWTGFVGAEWATQFGNLSADPLFCQPEAGSFYLQWGSPCLPANSTSACGLIGAYGFGGCNSITVTPDTWARVKARYR